MAENMTNIREKLTGMTILIVLALAVFIRTSAYGDFRLSVGDLDTTSYVNSSKFPVFSRDSFTGRRLFTTNLIYKLANDGQKCSLIAISIPAAGAETNRQIQPCFDKIALLQNILAIFAWCFLAWTTSRWLKNPFAKIAATILILTFGFTPQIAEWDSVLSPESVAISLFVISCALLQEIALRVGERNESINSRWIVLMLSGWVIIYALWVFVRDVNIYTIIISLFLMAALLIVKKFRQSKVFLITGLTLIALFILGYASAKASLRAEKFSLMHSFNDFIIPSPGNMAFFKKFGMPDISSPSFENWFNKNATSLYGLFLLSHPRFVAQTMSENSYFFISDFLQPYFPFSNSQFMNNLMNISEFIHPQSSAIYLIDILMLLGLTIAAIKRRDSSLIAWSWLGWWIFLIALVTLIVSFFGDTAGTRRHIYPSVETFRLFLWVFLPVYLDRIVSSKSDNAIRE